LRLGFVATYIGVVGALLVYFNLVTPCSRPFPIAREWALLGLLAGMLLVERFEVSRPAGVLTQRLAIGLLIVRAVLVQGAVAADCSHMATLLYAVIPFAALFTLGILASRLIAAGCFGLILLQAWQMSLAGALVSPNSLTPLVVAALLLVFMLVFAGHIDREQKNQHEMRQLLAELEVSHRQLQEYAARVAELAAASERNRLARDIHDSLGHYLTAINIQLEKAQAYRARNPAEADQAIRDAKQTARAALEDVRQSVSTLRASSDKFSLKKSLADLVGRMDSDDLQIDYHLAGDEGEYAAPVLTVLYRVAQEGLTNIQKHAQAHHVDLDVELGDKEALLRLRDDGCGFDAETLGDASALSQGYGIRGLQERLEMVRGQMVITSSDCQGTELKVVVPRNPAQLAAI